MDFTKKALVSQLKRTFTKNGFTYAGKNLLKNVIGEGLEEEVEFGLESLAKTTYQNDFEIVIVEDGSTIPCGEVIQKYMAQLNIAYFYKENSG